MKQFLVLTLLSLWFVATAASSSSTTEDVPAFLRRELKSCDICNKVNLFDASCTGFQIKNRDVWDSYAERDSADPTMADDEECDQRCCTNKDEDDCCEDYPTGYYVAFVIGIVGMALMFAYCAWAAIKGRKSKVANEEEKE